jgi:hypothetical protein
MLFAPCNLVPLLTPDRRYIIVRGQLWRAANPNLSEERREELIATLMQARRDIARALRAHDHEGERAARRVVHRTKVALGERGPRWWSDAPDYNRRRVENTPYAEWFERQLAWERAILELLEERSSKHRASRPSSAGTAPTICPSEVARRAQPNRWRETLPEIRDAAKRLAARGEIEITQRRKVVAPDDEIRGPIRLAFARDRKRR